MPSTLWHRVALEWTQVKSRGRGIVRYPVTPDGRYFVVRGRLWRCTDPSLSRADRERLVAELMAARRAVAAAKRALGERGPVWWTDGAPDYNRRLVRNTPYADWYAADESRGCDGEAER